MDLTGHVVGGWHELTRIRLGQECVSYWAAFYVQDYGWLPAKVDKPEQADPSSPKPHKCDEPRAVVIRLYQDPNTRFGENDALPSDITNTVCWKSVCRYGMS